MQLLQTACLSQVRDGLNLCLGNVFVNIIKPRTLTLTVVLLLGVVKWLQSLI
jgi:hypothetical protein